MLQCSTPANATIPPNATTPVQASFLGASFSPCGHDLICTGENLRVNSASLRLECSLAQSNRQGLIWVGLAPYTKSWNKEQKRKQINLRAA